MGLDGVPWSLINGLIKEGLIPNIAELLDESLKINLYSTDPPWTPPAWTSIASGVNPGKHGIYSFYNAKKLDFGFATKLITGVEAKYPRLHEVLSIYKRKCFVANLPGTYYVPSYVSSYCVVVSDWLSPSIRVNSQGYEYLRIAFGKNLIAKDLQDPYILSNKLGHRVKSICRAIEKFVMSNSVDLIFVVFSELDWIMHKDIKFVKLTDSELYTGVLEEIDSLAKKLYMLGYRLVIVSDHGFKVYNKVYYPRKALEEHGIKTGDISYSWRKSRILYTAINWIKNIQNLKP